MVTTPRPVILAVDDDVSFLEALHVILDEDYVVLDANGVGAAVAVLQHRKVNLILLDLLLPRVDGFALLERLRESIGPPPIVVLSAINDASAAATAIRAGAIDYVTKPFDEAEMLKIIQESIGSGVRSTATTPTQARCPLLFLVGLPLGTRASLAVILGPRCRVHSAASIADALALDGIVAPDLVVLKEANAGLRMRSGSLERLRAALSPRQMLVVASEDERSSSSPWPSDCLVLGSPLALTALTGEIARQLPAVGANWTKYSRPVARVLDLIAVRYADMTVKGLGRELAIAPYYLSRLFRVEVGVTLKSYLTRVRIEAAKCLLLETDDTIDAIASSVGFHDSSHLSRLFVWCTSIRPSVYRRIHRLRHAG
jgi:CheY-like chemotaxis protein/AraC-like DNA-binding protein